MDFQAPEQALDQIGFYRKITYPVFMKKLQFSRSLLNLKHKIGPFWGFRVPEIVLNALNGGIATQVT